ncbi:MAG: RNA-guided endonuclease InsQ/TnpB family protein [Lachnospiraceae bacterium]
MKQYHGIKLNVFDDPFLLNVMQQTLDAVLNRPVWMPYLPQRRKSGKKTSSRKADTDAAYIAYQFRGYPTQEQAHAMEQTIGASRWMWNQMLSDRMDVLKNTGKDTLRPTPAAYKTKERSWLKDCDSYAFCNVQLNLERTFSDWHTGNCGRPRFKKKHVCPDTYTTNKDKRCNNISLSAEGLVLPKVPGTVAIKCHRAIRKGGVLKSVTVTHEPDGKWMFSIRFAYPKQQSSPESRVLDALEAGTCDSLSHIGLDMSLTHLYVDSHGDFPFYTLSGANGSTVAFEKQYNKLEKEIAKAQRHLSRMQKDSHNYGKQLIRIARLHARATHARQDFLRQMAIRLVRQYSVISIEDLDMQGMKKALRFGKSVSDISWGAFIQYLEAACRKIGTLLIRVSKWFPSSKKCSHCGNIKKDLKLNERTYICPKCGHVMDRDHQAAVNIDREGFSIAAGLFNRKKKMLPKSRISVA